jgi:spore coat polysaccharide biosynthesis protein SpsF
VKIVATIEARMASSRLPGKVLLPVRGRPLLHYLVARLRAVPSLDAIVLATTTSSSDDVLAAFAEREDIGCFRGSEEDVLARVIGAAESAAADVVVETTGDCPIIDPEIVEQTIRMFQAHTAAYVSNAHIRSYPDGMDTQVFSLESLRRSASMTDAPLDREHVTLYMRNHPEIFPQVHLVAPPQTHWPELGLTLDEQADYELIGCLIEHFGDQNPLFGCLDVVRLLRTKPDWIRVNQDVRRKGDS